MPKFGYRQITINDNGNIFYKKVFIFTRYSVIITVHDYECVTGLEKSLTNVNISVF